MSPLTTVSPLRIASRFSGGARFSGAPRLFLVPYPHQYFYESNICRESPGAYVAKRRKSERSTHNFFGLDIRFLSGCVCLIRKVFSGVKQIERASTPMGQCHVRKNEMIGQKNVQKVFSYLVERHRFWVVGLSWQIRTDASGGAKNSFTAFLDSIKSQRLHFSPRTAGKIQSVTWIFVTFKCVSSF